MQLRCTSCKKLKIGCDKVRPKCEYCRSTGRECIYLEPPPRKKLMKVAKKRKGDKPVIPHRINTTIHNDSTKVDNCIGNDVHHLLPDDDSYGLHELKIDDDNIDYPLGNIEFTLAATKDINGDGTFHVTNPSLTMEDDVDLEFWNDQHLYDLNLQLLGDLNAGYKQLGILKFEYRLLTEFPRLFVNKLIDTPVEQLNPMEKLYLYEMPNLWKISPIVRNNVFSLTTMFMYCFTDVGEIIVDDLGPAGEYQGLVYDLTEDMLFSPSSTVPATSTSTPMANTTSPISLSSPPSSSLSFNDAEYNHHLNTYLDNKIDTISLKRELHLRSLNYFQQSIKETCKLLDNVTEGGLQDIDRAAEITISALLLFTFLGIQNFKLIKLINFNQVDEVDVVRLVKTMKTAIGKSFPLLFNTKYHGIFHLSELLTPKFETIKFPMIEKLKTEFVETFGHTSYYTNDLFKNINNAINTFDVCLTRGIKEDDNSLIFRWIFLLDPIVYDLMELNDKFSIKLLYYYSFICIVTKFTYKSGIFNDFMEYYINTNDNLDSEEQILYDIACGGEDFDRCDFLTFDPSKGSDFKSH